MNGLFVVVQRWNSGTVNQGIPRTIFGPFKTYDAAQVFIDDRQAEDPKAEFLYSAMLLVKP